MRTLRRGVKPADAARNAGWFFLFLLLWGIFGVWRASQKMQQSDEVLKYASTTQGEVTYVQLTGKGSPSLRYVYEVMGRKYSGIANPSVRSNYRQDPHVGDSIEVSFSTKHPNWSIAGNPKRQADYGLAVDLSWVFVVIGLIGLPVSRLITARLKKAEDIQSSPAPHS